MKSGLLFANITKLLRGRAGASNLTLERSRKRIDRAGARGATTQRFFLAMLGKTLIPNEAIDLSVRFVFYWSFSITIMMTIRRPLGYLIYLMEGTFAGGRADEQPARISRLVMKCVVFVSVHKKV